MPPISGWLRLTAAVLIAIIIINPFYSVAQINAPLDTGFSQAIAAVNNAEAAGATPNEILPLVTLINRALEFNQEASTLLTNQTQLHDELVSRANQILTNVTSQANDLTTKSAQRTQTNRIIAYASGIILAVLGMFAFALAAAFHEKYRIKRTFRMRVKRK
jgi:hypothetical protein